MRKIIVIFILFQFSISFFGQNYHVDTLIHKKNCHFELYGGGRCVNSPYGYEYAQKLKETLGNRMSLLTIHSGPLSIGRGPSNLQSKVGNELYKWMNIDFFPAGVVNRRNFGYGALNLGISRNNWGKSIKSILKEDSPVNLWAKAKYDSSNRMLKITVEGYFTSSTNQSNNYLDVYVIQNNIKAYQYIAGEGDKTDYLHQKILRASITDGKGVHIMDCKKGKYFSKEFSYEVPTFYNEIEVDDANLELVIFVSESQFGEVLNTIQIHPDYDGKTLPLKVNFSLDNLGITDGYSYKFINTTLTNECNSTIKSIDFIANINGKTENYTWHGELYPFETRDINIPLESHDELLQNNTYSISIIGLNGEKYVSENEEGTFGDLETMPKNFLMSIKTDNEASDNTFNIYNMDGKCVKHFGPYPDGDFGEYKEEVVLEAGKIYCLEINDKWGNGINVSDKCVSFYKENGSFIKSLNYISDFGSRFFFKTPIENGIEQMSVVNEKIRVYDTLGRFITCVNSLKELTKLNSGLYIISSNTEKKQLYIHY